MLHRRVGGATGRLESSIVRRTMKYWEYERRSALSLRSWAKRFRGRTLGGT